MERSEQITTLIEEYADKFCEGVPPENQLSPSDLWDLLHNSEEHVLLVDTRDPVEYNVSRIRGSISYVPTLWTANLLLDKISSPHEQGQHSIREDNLLFHDWKA